MRRLPFFALAIALLVTAVVAESNDVRSGSADQSFYLFVTDSIGNLWAVSGTSGGGLLLSTDTGLSWSRVGTINTRKLFFDGAGRLWARDQNSYTIMSSLDAGQTWDPRPLPEGPDGRSASAWVIAPGDVAYALRWPRMPVAMPLFRSTNGGDRWDSVSEHEVRSQYGNVELWSTHQGTLISNSDATTFRSTDGGLSWLRVPYGDVRDLESLPDGRLYLMTPTSLYMSLDQGATWRYLNPLSRLENATTFTLAADSTIFAGAQNGIARSTNNGRTWRTTTIDQPGAIHNVAATSGIVIAGHSRGGLYRSTDMGDTWTRIDLGPVSAVETADAPPAEFDLR